MELAAFCARCFNLLAVLNNAACFSATIRALGSLRGPFRGITPTISFEPDPLADHDFTKLFSVDAFAQIMRRMQC
jgi:hypothetical protein